MKKYLLLLAAICLTITGFSQGANGLIAHWDMNGSVNDVSGNGHNGTANNITPAMGQNGMNGNGYYFNGINSYITVPYAPTLNLTNYSICAIVKVMGFYNGNCQANIILTRGTTAVTGGYGLEFDDNAYDGDDCNAFDSTKEVFYGTAGGLTPANLYTRYYMPTVMENKWYNIVVTFNDTAYKTYINDSLINTTFVSAPGTYGNSTDGISIGYDIFEASSGYPYPFKGIIDDIRLYNRVLTDSEITTYSTICPNFIINQPSNDTVTSGNTAHFSIADTGVGTYQWQQNSGTGFVNLSNAGIYSGVTTNTLTITNPTVVISNDIYRCIRSNAPSCTDTSSSATLIVESNAGINNVNLKNEIIISPNPAHNVVTIALSSVSRGNIQLINTLGQVIANKEIVGNNISFDLSYLPAGIYILRTQSNEQTAFSKIMKE